MKKKSCLLSVVFVVAFAFNGRADVFTGADLGVLPSSPSGPNSTTAAANFDTAAALLEMSRSLPSRAPRSEVSRAWRSLPASRSAVPLEPGIIKPLVIPLTRLFHPWMDTTPHLAAQISWKCSVAA